MSTFGTNTEIIKESLGLFCTADCAGDYYSQKDETTREAVRETRETLKRNGVKGLDELWLLATDQANLQESLKEIKDWNRENQIVKKVQIFVLKDVSDIVSKKQADAFHNMTIKVVASAQSKVRKEPKGKLLISLAGGRKTMSSDLQEAAYGFGFDALLHILSSKKTIVPMVIAENVPGNENLKDLSESNSFQFNEREFGDENYFDVENLKCLDAVRKRLEESRCFYSNLYQSNKSENIREMFPALYTISSAMREKLEKCKIGNFQETKDLELSVLRALPKADLHCHLGGVLRTNELVEVAETLSAEVLAEKEKMENLLLGSKKLMSTTLKILVCPLLKIRSATGAAGKNGGRMLLKKRMLRNP